jgi:hypothetical protein
MCALCGTGSDGGYFLPVVISVAVLVGFVAWLQKKRTA